MRRHLYGQKPMEDINVTPLLDLAWTLLVVFIICITAALQGIKVNLPQASNAPVLDKPKTKAITLRADGQIFLDTYPVSLPELGSLLRQYKALDPDLPVVIKADAKIYYERVVEVLDLLGELEISQLGLVTQQLVK